MSYRYFEVGYKVVKLGKHTVSCAMGTLGGLMQRPFLLGHALKSGAIASAVVAISFTASAGIDQKIPETGFLSVSLGATNSWTKEADLKASLSARFQF